jgi:hypothetical protein
MSQETLDRVLERLRNLEPHELEEVQRALSRRMAANGEAAKREAFDRALLTSGLVKEVKNPTPEQLVEMISRPLITVKGRQISETVVEERR